MRIFIQLCATTSHSSNSIPKTLNDRFIQRGIVESYEMFDVVDFKLNHKPVEVWLKQNPNFRRGLFAYALSFCGG
jgi:hypothetical protein